MMRTYYRMLLDRSEDDSAGKMKQFATYFTHGVTEGGGLRASIYKVHEATEIIAFKSDSSSSRNFCRQPDPRDRRWYHHR